MEKHISTLSNSGRIRDAEEYYNEVSLLAYTIEWFIYIYIYIRSDKTVRRIFVLTP